MDYLREGVTQLVVQAVLDLADGIRAGRSLRWILACLRALIAVVELIERILSEDEDAVKKGGE